MANPIKKNQRIKNQVESLNEQGGILTSNGTSLDLLQEILGLKEKKILSRKDFKPGESIEISSLRKANKEADYVLTSEFSIFSQERKETDRKIAELKAELKAIISEVKSLERSTKNIQEEIRPITEQIPQNPGIYHIFFFEQILKIVKNARLEVEKASVWLTFSNKRAEKKYWGRYKKGGASFLLSPDHYLTRSAG